MLLDKCKIIDLPKINDPRGNLTFLESCNHIPFDMDRVYYLYDVPGGSERGGHAHKECNEFLISVSGSFDVILSDCDKEKRFHLNRPYQGLYICPMVWRVLDNFSSGAVCLVISSHKYSEEDYYRDYLEYQTAVELIQ